MNNTGIVAGVSAGGGALVGYLIGTSGKTTVKFIYVTGHPKYNFELGMLVVEETKRAVWIEDENTFHMLKWLFNDTKPAIIMPYQEFISKYQVVEPGQLEWNQNAANF